MSPAEARFWGGKPRGLIAVDAFDRIDPNQCATVRGFSPPPRPKTTALQNSRLKQHSAGPCRIKGLRVA